MWVVKNRANGKARALKDVILAPYQFSCFNDGDPSRDKLSMARIESPESWGACHAIARLILGGHTLDPTDGATHYYARSIPTPYWARPETGWVEHTVIGHHIFGRAR
jgi:spore germination cell wall hydrolase CwlJ-like protein